MVTVVSCYYKIYSKFAHEIYTQWIDNFMNIGFKSVIYCNKESFDILSESYKESEKLKYRIIEIEDFKCC